MNIAEMNFMLKILWPIGMLEVEKKITNVENALSQRT
jgi:hypothetical protein